MPHSGYLGNEKADSLAKQEAKKQIQPCFLNSNPELKNMPSAQFNNIDGNKSNFDNFGSDISRYCHLFSFIDISETNIKPCHKGLYKIPGYTSQYNAKHFGKIFIQY